jgi:hypothetical protein
MVSQPPTPTDRASAGGTDILGSNPRPCLPKTDHSGKQYTGQKYRSVERSQGFIRCPLSANSDRRQEIGSCVRLIVRFIDYCANLNKRLGVSQNSLRRSLVFGNNWPAN